MSIRLRPRRSSGVLSSFRYGVSGLPRTDDQIRNGASGEIDLDGNDESDYEFEELSPQISRVLTNLSQEHHEATDVFGKPVDDSAYAEVRAAVSPEDDISLSINTPRMWTLSLLFAIVGSATNMFFSLRYPSVSITPVVALLLVHPLGLLWDGIFKRSDDPQESFVDGTLLPSHDSPHSRSFIQLRRWLGQGRWNEKEHCLVYVASNVAFGFAFATDVIVEQQMFYKQECPIIYQVLLVLSTQILGYAVAGMSRQFLVRPPAMIWPGLLVSTAMFTTLHKDENKPADGWLISRWRFFVIVFLGSFVFYFLPGLLFPALSYFNVITWFAPESVVVANLFGTSSGLGLFPMSFDWSQIAYIGSPLVTPFWAAMNVMSGLLLVMWIVAPILYYANVLYSSYMPILSASVFDNTGKAYDVTRILQTNFTFDAAAYQTYSPVFLPITYVLSYALQFASLTALLTHTYLWHGRDILRQTRDSFRSESMLSQESYHPTLARSTDALLGDGSGFNQSKATTKKSSPYYDVHNRLCDRYPDVPVSWYLVTGLTMLMVGMFLVEYYEVHLPWYGLLLALSICIVLYLPIGIVMAIANQQISIYLICQLVSGALFPGRPVANMIFVTFGYITSTQALKFSSDLKLGHYMHIPPRSLFAVQMIATLTSSLTQIGVLNWMLANIPNICTPSALNGFTCPIARVHFNGSILWGVVGPSRFFGAGALYRHLIWAFPIGAIAPVLVWLIARNASPSSNWRKINLPILFGSLSWIPPATGLNFSVWALVCFLFNYVIKRRKSAWWGKYNMTLSAALDAGVAFGVGVVFFGFVYTGVMNGFSWWGTEVFKLGCDWRGCAWKGVGAGGRFGPEKW